MIEWENFQTISSISNFALTKLWWIRSIDGLFCWIFFFALAFVIRLKKIDKNLTDELKGFAHSMYVRPQRNNFTAEVIDEGHGFGLVQRLRLVIVLEKSGQEHSVILTQVETHFCQNYFRLDGFREHARSKKLNEKVSVSGHAVWPLALVRNWIDFGQDFLWQTQRSF